MQRCGRDAGRSCRWSSCGRCW
uniref:AtTLP3 n=1 Tax=Arundo donax TaxID=35708 RepID=A0A0A8Y538_ARUDO